MKVYYFCLETGIYQGEGFLDERDLNKVDGVTSIPPPPHNRGEVPFYDFSGKNWTLNKLQRYEESD